MVYGSFWQTFQVDLFALHQRATLPNVGLIVADVLAPPGVAKLSRFGAILGNSRDAATVTVPIRHPEVRFQLRCHRRITSNSTAFLSCPPWSCWIFTLAMPIRPAVRYICLPMLEAIRKFSTALPGSAEKH